MEAGLDRLYLDADMSKTHIVKQGETLSSIAADNGFTNFHTILEDPNNADLSSDRDPHILFPGDQVFIPDPIEKTEQRATGAVHKFVLDIKPLFLRMKLLNLDEKPLKGAPCDVTLEPAPSSPPDAAGGGTQTDGQGILEQQIRPAVKSGRVVAHVPSQEPAAPAEQKLPYDLRVGHLNPVTKLSGQQARLNNLGYFAGYTLRDIDEFVWAVEEFLCDHGTIPVTKRPGIKPAPPDGEDDNSDPANASLKTGVQESSTRRTISKVHDGQPEPNA